MSTPSPSGPSDPFAAGPVTWSGSRGAGASPVPGPTASPPPVPGPTASPPPGPGPTVKPPPGPAGRFPVGRRARPTALWWYAGAAAALVAIGLVVVLVLVLNGSLGSGHGLLAGGPGQPDVRPPLARLCPPPTGDIGPSPTDGASGAAGQGGAGQGGAAAEPAGARTVDPQAGISYRAYGPPWQTWPYSWRMGTLEVPYRVGQYFVTETYAAGDYLASILSGAVPATVNDGVSIDIECTGRQVAADARASYYPQPNTMDLIRDERTTLGGRPAWVTEFRLHFHEQGLTATDELAAVALIDVGRPTAAVLYVSIPGTHREWDHAVDEVLSSVRTVS
jgi:hypothetical protein